MDDDRSWCTDRRCRSLPADQPPPLERRSTAWRARCSSCSQRWPVARSGGCDETPLVEHHAPVPNQLAKYGVSHQFAIIGGFQLSAIFRKPSLARAAAPPNLHKRPSTHCFPARSFFGGFRTPAPIPGRPFAPGRHPKPFPKAVVRRKAANLSGFHP